MAFDSLLLPLLFVKCLRVFNLLRVLKGVRFKVNIGSYEEYRIRHFDYFPNGKEYMHLHLIGTYTYTYITTLAMLGNR